MPEQDTIRYLSVASWNINGITDRSQDKFFLSELSKHDIVFLLETHVRDTDVLSFEGFHCIQVNHHKVKANGKTDGGIAMLCKPHLQHGITTVNKSHDDYVWFKLDKAFFGLENNIYLCAAYLPHGNSCYLVEREQDVLESIESDITKYTHDGYIMLLGDLNARTGTLSDYIVDDNDRISCEDHLYKVDDTISPRKNEDTIVNNRGEKLGELCVQCQLRILNGRTLGDSRGYFTCHRPQGSSTVDYMILSEELLHRITYFHVHNKLHISDHCKISMQITCHINKACHENITLSPLPRTYKWNDQSISQYQAALADPQIQTQVQKLFELKTAPSEPSINKQIQILYNIFHEAAAQSLAPKKTHSTKPKNKPWFNHTLRQLRQNVNTKGKLLKQFPYDPVIRGSYHKLLKDYNRTRKFYHRQFKQKIINELDELRENAPRHYWKLLSKLKNEEQGNVMLDQIKPQDWLFHFKNLNMKSQNPLPTIPLDQLPADKIEPSLNFQIEERETLTAIRNLKNGKASGPDGICNEMIKYGQHIFSKPLTKIFNAILDSGSYPTTWAQGHISPIHKTGNPLDANNYRGITIGSCVAKVFNTILNKRLDKYLSDNDIIHETQIAFQKNSRTSDHMFILRTLIDNTVSRKKKKLYTCFVDFRKAFDSLSHDAVFHKMKRNGINGRFLDTIQNMYQKTSLCVKTNGKLTPSFPGEVGVRQGDVLSPNLFKIFINDLPDFIGCSNDPPQLNCKPINCLLYADDLVLLSESQTGLQSSLERLQQYCTKWGLQVNIDKTKVIIFNTGKTKSHDRFTIGTHSIECVDNYKYLGINFNSSGSFDVAQASLYNKGLKAFFKLAKMLSTERASANTAMHLFDHTIKPILLYASEVWGTFKTNLKRITNNPNNVLEKAYEKLKAEKVHLKMCRYTLGVGPKTSITAIRGETGRLPVYVDIATGILKYLHHISNSNSDLLKQALLTNQQLNVQNKQCWLTWAQTIINEAGMTYQLVQQPTGKWLARAKKTLRIKYTSHWRTELYTEKWGNKQGNKLRTYRKFKTCFTQEPYLNIIVDRDIRKNIARLRTSSHALRIETGRYDGINPEHRLCTHCNSGEVENEEHFLTSCSIYQAERVYLFSVAQTACQNFNNLNGENKMIWLLSAEQPDVVLAVAKFTQKSFQIRKQLTILT